MAFTRRRAWVLPVAKTVARYRSLSSSDRKARFGKLRTLVDA